MLDAAISNCVIHTDTVGMVTVPVSLIVIIPLSIMYLIDTVYLLLSVFSPVDCIFLWSISLSMSFEILSSVIRA